MAGAFDAIIRAALAEEAPEVCECGAEATTERHGLPACYDCAEQADMTDTLTEED